MKSTLFTCCCCGAPLGATYALATPTVDGETERCFTMTIEHAKQVNGRFVIVTEADAVQLREEAAWFAHLEGECEDDCEYCAKARPSKEPHDETT